MAREELIAGLETATGPDRALDEQIALLRHHDELPPGSARPVGIINPAPYTASIDAALTLVPDDWTAWEVRSRQRKTRFYAELSRLKEPEGAEEYRDGDGSTPALALCIAALRARA